MEYLINYLDSSNLDELLLKPDMLILIGMAFIFWIVSLGKGKKSQRTNAMLADKKVIYELSRAAVRQLMRFDIENICLYAGSFKNSQIKPLSLWFSVNILGTPPSLFTPSANLGIKVIGSPGMGKTYGVIDPLLYSAIEQGFPIALYDYKASYKDGKIGEGGQMSVIGGYAARYGYNIKIFAPGKNYSCTINPLDFIKNDEDFSMARTLAQTFHANIQGANSKSDDFFGPSGIELIKASFLMAKNTQYPDIAMAHAILNLPDLGERLKYAHERGAKHYSVWNHKAFGQFLSAAKSEKTVAGILSQAGLTVSEFVQPDTVACILGKTNISLDLKPNEILIFQSDEERKRAINPSIAGIIEVLINKNFSYQRTTPLILSLDEYPSLKIDESVHWGNRHRSKGLVMIIGYQSNAQLLDTYGKDKAKTLMSGLKQTFLFNPNDDDTAKEWSSKIGDREIIIKNNSTSFNRGGGRQRSISNQSVLTKIKNLDDIITMPKFSCIYTNSDSEAKYRKRASIPWDIPQVKVSLSDRKKKKISKEIWIREVAPKIATREIKKRENLTVNGELVIRDKLAEELFPLPPYSSNSNINTIELMSHPKINE